MSSKFVETGELDVLQGRGRKRLSHETAEEAALAVVGRATGSHYSSTSAPEALLRVQHEDDQVISRIFPTAWPPGSLDLNTCDFSCVWVWRFQKDRVYGESIRTLPEFIATITHHVAGIDRETLLSTV
ncbi:hypothetical protein AVEN_267372-1 [Araneus ventricosus]|uniref:Uncharacterized protein n=1 Tax=Araneus ventricosus TaxID=182803 RepID=A0A4Y2A8Y2_ARAVE|nr:hypothetical protein AVEN_267372-1 [Araneus ventricosus]